MSDVEPPLFQRPSNSWFPGEIERVLKEDYVPTNEDILHSRAATIGVVSYDYEYQNINIRIVDVGGTRSQRNNWLKLFQDFPSFVFVASLGDYEKPSFENESNVSKHFDDNNCDHIYWIVSPT